MTKMETTKDTKRILPAGWRWVRLGEVCEQDRQIVEPNTHEADSLTYYSLEHIESETGRILKAPVVHVEDAGKSTTFRFDERHVLYGKLRPYLNKVALPGTPGRCTTEMIPLICSDHIDRVFLAWVLRRRETVEIAMRGKTGSRMPRADMDNLLTFKIPLPPLSEQRRIAVVLREQMAAVEKARAAAQARLEAAERLPDAFMEQFLEGAEAVTWPLVSMADVCEIVATQVDPKLPEFRDLPHVNGENLESGTGSIFGIKSAAEDCMTSGKYLFEPGVVLYSKLRPYLRKAAAVNFRGLCSADMYPLTFDRDRVDIQFALWVLLSRSFTEYAVSESQRARMPKLNRDQLFAWKFPVPSLAVQRRIVGDIDQRMQTAKRAIAALREELQTINALPAALLRRAFAGEV